MREWHEIEFTPNSALNRNEHYDLVTDLLIDGKTIKGIRAEAIDEFAEEMKSLVYKWFESGVINTCTIDKIAERLKGE